MKVTLQPITSDNWIDCISLLPTEEQVRIGFVVPNSVSIEISYDVANLAMAHLCRRWAV